MKLREKELERAKLEAMIIGEPQFPDTERGLVDAEEQKKEALSKCPALRNAPAVLYLINHPAR